MIIDYISGAFEQSQGYFVLGLIITWSGDLVVIVTKELRVTAKMYNRGTIASLYDKNVVSEFNNRSVTAKARVE